MTQMTSQQLEDLIQIEDAKDAAAAVRAAKFAAIAKANATCGLDQNDVDGYRDNLMDTLAEINDLTAGEVTDAITAYDALIFSAAK